MATTISPFFQSVLSKICVLIAFAVYVEGQAKDGPQLTPDEEDRIKYNGALPISEDYAVIFNILLWFGIGFLLTVISICVAIASMDPGRDSLIYRVTSAQRFKKEN